MSGPLRRVEPAVTERYRKNQGDEKFLAALNTILAPHEEALYEDLEETHATLHVIGAPRSGTTLLNQLICSSLDMSYVNNLIAAFWRAPVIGIRLSNKLLGPPPESSYESEFGRTRSVYEPHEFGYFWSALLGYQEPRQRDLAVDPIDWNRVRNVLLNMSGAFGGPAVYKSFYLGWHIERMQQVLPRTCFVWIRRDPTQNALSLLKMRRDFLGSVEKWASLKPREYDRLKDAPYWEQVAGQVYYLERSLAAQIRSVGGRNVLQVSYEQLCRQPGEVLERIRNMLYHNGSPVEYLNPVPESFEQRATAPSTKEFRQVDTAIAKLYANPIDEPV